MPVLWTAHPAAQEGTPAVGSRRARSGPCGFHEVHARCLGVFRRRTRVVDLAEAFHRLRRCYPRRRLFVIMDNLRNIHDHPRFLGLLRRLRITPVFTPTEAS